MEKNWIEAKKYLKSQEIDQDLIMELEKFRQAYSVDELVKERVAKAGSHKETFRKL